MYHVAGRTVGGRNVPHVPHNEDPDPRGILLEVPDKCDAVVLEAKRPEQARPNRITVHIGAVKRRDGPLGRWGSSRLRRSPNIWAGTVE